MIVRISVLVTCVRARTRSRFQSRMNSRVQLLSPTTCSLSSCLMHILPYRGCPRTGLAKPIRTGRYLRTTDPSLTSPSAAHQHICADAPHTCVFCQRERVCVCVRAQRCPNGFNQTLNYRPEPMQCAVPPCAVGLLSAILGETLAPNRATVQPT